MKVEHFILVYNIVCILSTEENILSRELIIDQLAGFLVVKSAHLGSSSRLGTVLAFS
jgi:hypothetical protein